MDQLTTGPEVELMTSVSASFRYPVHKTHTDLEDHFTFVRKIFHDITTC